MRKLIFLILIAGVGLFAVKFLLLSDEIIPDIEAQQATAVKALHSVCLNTLKCEDNPNTCINRFESNGNPQYTTEDHRAHLTIDPAHKAIPSERTFVTECITANDQIYCTTGDSNLDNELFGADKLNEMKQVNTLQDYRFIRLYEIDVVNKQVRSYDSPRTFTATSDGDLPVLEWKSYTNVRLSRQFRAWNIVYISPESTTGTSGQGGAVGGQQQGNLGFPTPTPVSGASGCTEIWYDPEGRVFDAKSLHPIPGAAVRLYQKDQNGNYQVVSAPTVNNPFITFSDGRYAFYVQSQAFYRLEIISAPNYITTPLINSLTDINPLYRNIYSDIYPAETGVEIWQEQETVHRDIPLIPNNPNGYTYPVERLSKVESVDPRGVLKVEGMLSHPLATVRVYSYDPAISPPQKANLITTTQSDKKGIFVVMIDQNAILPYVSGIYEYEAYNAGTSRRGQTSQDLANAGSNVLGAVAQAQNNPALQAVKSAATTSTVDQPFPTYLEGYAVDASGKIIPNALVALYLTFSNVPSYVTYSNADGSFRIASENIPDMRYNIVFIAPNGTRNKLTPAQFLAAVRKQPPLSQTSKYNPFSRLSQAQVASLNAAEKRMPAAPTSYYRLQDEQNRTISSPVKRPGEGEKVGGNNSSATSPTTPNNTILVAVILLLLLGAVGIILAIYIYKKNNSPSAI